MSTFLSKNTIQWLKLISIVLLMFIFFTYVSPKLFHISSAWLQFIKVQDEIGVESGALYYSDVAVTQDAEAHVREAVRLGMLERETKGK